MAAPINQTVSQIPIDDPDEAALIDKWNEAIRGCESDLHEHELEAIRSFHNPQNLSDDLLKRLKSSAQGKMQGMLSKVSPFFGILEEMLRLFTNAMPTRSIPLTLVSGGAYLAVKYSADFDQAANRMVDCLEKIRTQLILFREHSASLHHQTYRQGLMDMFCAMIRFWVATVRFLSRNPRDDEGNAIVVERWHTLHQKFIRALEEIEEAVKFVQQLQESAERNSALAQPALQADMVNQLDDVDLSAARFPCHEIPHQVQHFLGRSTQIAEIKKSLQSHRTPMLHTVFVAGFAGVGKSSLVIEAAHQMESEKLYDSILWLNASNRDRVRESFTKIACRLLLEGADEKSDKDMNYMLVKQWLDKTRRKWLLIYDNVDDSSVLDEFLPPEKGSLIVTTRYKALEYGHVGSKKLIELDHLTPDDSLKLFNNYRLMRDSSANVKYEEEETKALLEHINWLTLGVKQMASYVGSKRMKIADFKEKYDTTAKNILDHKAPSATHTLGTLWDLQFKDMKPSDDNFASTLLGLIAMCSPDAIPRQLFDLDDPLDDSNIAGFCQYVEDFERAEDELERKALIEIDRDKDQISVHRLTQQAFLYHSMGLYDAKSRQDSFEGLVSLLDCKFPRYGREKSLLYEWDTCSRYLPHVSALAKHVKASKGTRRRLIPNDLFVELLKNATWYLQEIGEIQESEDLLEIAFDACQDKDSLVYAYLCNTKVVLAMDTNEIEQGHSYSGEAIAIREKLLQPNDIDIAISHNNFANILVNEADFDKALKHMTIADDIWVGAGKTDDTYRALVHLNLGRVYSLKGLAKDVTVAEQYFMKAEEFYSQSANNLFLIGVHYTWGTMLMNNDDMLGAMGKFEAALAQAEKSLPFKLVIAAILYKLAVVNLKLGLPQRSKSQLERAMPIAYYHKREGFIGRLGRQLALIIQADPNSSVEEKLKAENLSRTAEEIKKRLWKLNGSLVKRVPKDEEDEWAWLVAGWYR